MPVDYSKERFIFYSALNNLPRKGRVLLKLPNLWQVAWCAWPEYLAKLESPGREDEQYAKARQAWIKPPDDASYHPTVRFEFLEPGKWPEEEDGFETDAQVAGNGFAQGGGKQRPMQLALGH